MVTVVGGGLAGCEVAWQLACRGVAVVLVEMKPARMSPAHTTPLLGELVCSNSLRSNRTESPAGLLKEELRRAGSLVVRAADATRVPAGDALAVDRQAFARFITGEIVCSPHIRLERRTVDVWPEGPTVVAAGPLVAGGLERLLRGFQPSSFYFYDAIAPIVDGESIDWSHAFRGSRYGREGSDEGDYVNCPLTREEYEHFVDALLAGRKVLPRAFEEPRYFEGCLPIEVIAERGRDALAFGPMKPAGLADPRPGARPTHAVVQLRAENRYGTSYNLVGFQTRLAQAEQKAIFSLVPALARAEYLRYGSIHRNSYLHAPSLLDGELRLRARPDVSVAGQIAGVEGYIESTAVGLLVAGFVAARLAGRQVEAPPAETALGGLYHHLTRARQPGERFEPTNIHFGLLPPLPGRMSKLERRQRMVRRARAALGSWLELQPVAVLA